MQHGHQLTFYTQQDRTHGHQPLTEWLLGVAAEVGIVGATVVGGLEGVGHDGGVHRINLFDLSQQPVQVTMVVTSAQAEALLARLNQEDTALFCVQVPALFGTVGRAAPPTLTV